MRARPRVPRPRFLIYALVDPDTELVRYIGRSSAGLDRPREHRWKCKRERTHKAAWIRSLLRAGKDYVVRILEVCTTEAETVDAEIVWIANAGRLGWDLTNATDGGEGSARKKLNLPDAEIVRRYLDGESELALALAYNVNRWTITRRLREAGAERRDGSEANRLRMTKLTPKQRVELATPAHTARRGSVVSAETRERMRAGQQVRRKRARMMQAASR